ncbi:MAG: hypothetical protein D6704_01310 [Nitrospirae bacterium]|nr:MAG: hypothetical protein D6704_01310 [Nitrospirota bacterium]
MNSQLAHLVELQKLDLKIHDLHEQQRKIPERIRAAQIPLLQATKELEAVTTAVKTLTAERRRNEHELQVQEDHIRKLRSRLMELKTNKEYQAHLFEIELANKKKDALEEKVLLSMEQLELKQKELEDLRNRVKRAEETFGECKIQLETQAQALAHELDELRQRQQALLPLLDKSVYARYMTLKSSLKVLVVAQVREGICQGCLLQLPPQLVAQVKRGDELLSCPFCQRILYWECEAESEAASSQDQPDQTEEPISQTKTSG